MVEPFTFLANHSNSLMYDVDNNRVEQFNSVIWKFIGGKRINYCLRRSYRGRVYGAVLSYNSKKPIKSVVKCISGKSPMSRLLKKYERRKELRRIRKEKIVRKRLIFLEGKSIPSTLSIQLLICDLTSETQTGVAKDYGPNCNKPDMDNWEYESARATFLTTLKRTTEEIISLEMRTRKQAECLEWREERWRLLTASNFGLICKRRQNSKYSVVVNNLLYREGFSTKATEYGKNNEVNAT